MRSATSCLRALGIAAGEAAAAATLGELGEIALPALARAFDAFPVFLARARSGPVAGAGLDSYRHYMSDFFADDPLGVAASRTAAPVAILERLVEPRLVRASRAYAAFHRPRDFEHHLVIRLQGARIDSADALVMGLTRGRRGPAFDERDLRLAELALPAFQGAARRLDRNAVAGNGLTRAESRVLALLTEGLSNAAIAGRLHVSVETVKTHLYRAFAKLGVSSRAEALVRLLPARR